MYLYPTACYPASCLFVVYACIVVGAWWLCAGRIGMIGFVLASVPLGDDPIGGVPGYWAVAEETGWTAALSPGCEPAALLGCLAYRPRLRSGCELPQDSPKTAATLPFCGPS
jgi:hypothetical protein